MEDLVHIVRFDDQKHHETPGGSTLHTSLTKGGFFYDTQVYNEKLNGRATCFLGSSGSSPCSTRTHDGQIHSSRLRSSSRAKLRDTPTQRPWNQSEHLSQQIMNWLLCGLRHKHHSRSGSSSEFQLSPLSLWSSPP